MSIYLSLIYLSINVYKYILGMWAYTCALLKIAIDLSYWRWAASREIGKKKKKKKNEQICLQLDESIPHQQDDYRGHI